MKRIFPVLLLLCLLAGCGAPAPTPVPIPAPTPAPTPVTEPLSFDAFLEESTARREAILAQQDPIDISVWTVDRPEQGDAWTEAEMDQLLNGASRPGELTLEEARADAETFFKLLRTTYGAYDYFGGDEVFFPLKDAALTALGQEAAPYDKALETVLADLLSPVLRDGHFAIGGRAPIAAHRMFFYYVPDLYFTDLTGLDERYVKPTVAPDGSIQYWFAVLSRDGSDLPASLGGHDLRWIKTAAPPRGASWSPITVPFTSQTPVCRFISAPG